MRVAVPIARALVVAAAIAACTGEPTEETTRPARPHDRPGKAEPSEAADATPPTPAPLGADIWAKLRTKPATTVAPVEPDASAPMATVFFVRDLPGGPRLVTESHPRPKTIAVLKGAVEAAIHERPFDPDYIGPWPAATTVVGVSVQGDTATIELSAEARRTALETVAIQAMIYTIHAAVPAIDTVVLRVGSATTLSGHAPLGTPIRMGKPEYALAPVQIESPAQGAITASPLVVTGVATVFEASVSWAVTKVGSPTIVAHGAATASTGAPGRGAWSATIPLPPGSYVVRAFEVSSRDGSETAIDDKQITVR